MCRLPPRLAARATGVAVAATTAAAAIATATAIAAAVAAGVATSRSTSVAASTTAAVAGRASIEAASGATSEATAASTTAVLSEVTVGVTTSTATTAAASTTSAAAAAEGRLAGNGLEERGDLLVGLLEKFHKFSDNSTVATVEESSGNTSVSSTAGTTNTMDVVVNVGREIIVDDVGDVGNIETTSSHSSSDEDGATTVSEELQSTLTLALGSVTVNGSGREVLVDEEVGQRVCHALGLDENESQTASMSVKNVKQNGTLVDILDVLDLLGDVLRGGTNTTNGKEDVVLEEVTSEHLDVAGEGGREHQSLALGNSGHVLTLDNASNLGLETHVKHAISLIEDEVLDVAQGDATSLYEIDQSTRGSNKQITTTLNLAKLRANIGTTVDDTRSDPGSVGKLARLFVDLRNQFSGGSQDQRSGVSLSLTAKLTSSAGGNSRGAVDEGLREDREEETTSLSGTSLGTSHEITAAHNDGDGVLLDGGGDLVVGHLDVAAQVLVQRRSGELVDSLGNILTRGLNGNVVVLLEVDTGVLLGRIIDSTEKLTLDTGVSRTGNVLSVAPLSVARATGSVVAATTARVTVEVAASARVSSAATPTTSAVATAAAAGSIVVVGRDVIAPVGLTSTVVLAN
jgi:hypothetical protein